MMTDDQVERLFKANLHLGLGSLGGLLALVNVLEARGLIDAKDKTAIAAPIAANLKTFEAVLGVPMPGIREVRQVLDAWSDPG